MHRKRSSSSVAAALTIPLLLCLPRTLVAALSINDYLLSSAGSFGSKGGGSLAKRNDSDFSQWGFYNPLDTGGYMITVSLFSLHAFRSLASVLCLMWLPRRPEWVWV